MTGKMDKDLQRSEYDRAFEPITSFHYFWRTLLYTIPVIGWIAVVVTALSDENNVNLREHARKFLWAEVIVRIVILILTAPIWFRLLKAVLHLFI